MVPRPPIVAILGHVDHGKTTLLDYIRKSRITAKEHGGITQKIGAYEIKTSFKDYPTNTITFIDTPGHEAFSQLRARGSHVADIAVLVVDAKDSLMPQTAESIYHIKTANIPMIVAANKIDLPEANIERVKNDLLKYEVIVEGKGGGVPVVPLSAKTGTGVNELLESILLLSSDLHLEYDPLHTAQAYIIEAKKDRRGIVVAVIITDGTLKIGDTVYAENMKAKVRSILNDQGQQVREAFPSTPFELLGFEEMPPVGSLLSTQEKKSEKIPQIIPQQPVILDLQSILHPKEEAKKLSVIIKTDSQGSLEAITQSIDKKENVEVILKAIGDIHKSDIFLAKTTGAIIIGFNVGVPLEVKDLAKQEKVVIKIYTIIYNLLEELSEVAELLKEKEEKEKNLKGEAKVLATFIIEGEKIVGVSVTKGKINKDDPVEVYRDNNLIGKTKLVSLKIRAKPVEEVKKNQEAGMVLSPQLDTRIGDVIKSIL